MNRSFEVRDDENGICWLRKGAKEKRKGFVKRFIG